MVHQRVHLRAVGDGATEVTFTLTFPTMKGVKSLAVPIAFPLFGKPDISDASADRDSRLA